MSDRRIDDLRTRRRTEDAIAQRADRRYLERGALDGNDVEDWRQAEREVRQSRQTRGSADGGESFV